MKTEKGSLWYRIIFVLAFLILIAGIWFPEQVAVSLSRNKPPLVTPHSIEMGDVALNQKATQSFIVLNPHFSAVHIRKMDTSCGCTAASPARTAVLPLQKVICTVEIQAKKRGAAKEYIVIKTDAGDREIPVTYNGI